jgi:hypothetical protein
MRCNNFFEYLIMFSIDSSVSLSSQPLPRHLNGTFARTPQPAEAAPPIAASAGLASPAPNAAKAKLMDSSKEDLIRLITKQMSKIKKLEDGACLGGEYLNCPYVFLCGTTIILFLI